MRNILEGGARCLNGGSEEAYVLEEAESTKVQAVGKRLSAESTLIVAAHRLKGEAGMELIFGMHRKNCGRSKPCLQRSNLGSLILRPSMRPSWRKSESCLAYWCLPTPGHRASVSPQSPRKLSQARCSNGSQSKSLFRYGLNQPYKLVKDPQQVRTELMQHFRVLTQPLPFFV